MASEALFGKSEPVLELPQTDSRSSKKRLGQISFGTFLENTSGTIWTGEIYMGKLFKMDLVYDTGSDWMVVEGSECETCEGSNYNIELSLQTGIAEQLTEEVSEREYGRASLKGKEYTDTVCILFSTCVEHFEFFLIEEQVGLKEPIDGLMGMARNNKYHLLPEVGDIVGPLYVEALYENGLIPENKFSFFFTEAGYDSWVDFGEPKLDNVREDASLVDVQLIEEDFFWAGYCQGVAFRDTSEDNSYSFGRINQFETE